MTRSDVARRRVPVGPMVLAVAAVAVASTACGSRVPPVEEYFSHGEAVAGAEAIRRGRPADLDRLIQAGLDVDHRGREGMNLLKWALFSDCLECFEMLLGAGASLEHFEAGEYTGKVEQTPLKPVMELAARAGDHRFLSAALAHGADPDSLDVYGKKTVIFAAVLHSRIENARLLVEAGADIDARDGDLESPLLAAVGYGNYEFACYLLDLGADPSLPNERGFTVADRIERYGQYVREDQREWLDRLSTRLGVQD